MSRIRTDLGAENQMSSFRLPAALCLFVGLFSLPTGGQAVTIPVANGAVAINGADGICSLWEAIENANSGAQTHADCAAGSGGEDAIALHPNGSYSFDGTTAEVPITTAVVVRGADATLTHLAGGFFDIAGSGFLKLYDLTLSGSTAPAKSAISGSGSLVIEGCILEENVNQSTDGGAVRMSWSTDNKSFEVRDSVLRNNVADSRGGAIYISGGASASNLAVSIERVTLEGNGDWIFAGGVETNNGGALYVGGDFLAPPLSVTIVRSEFKSNYGDSGGAIYIDDHVEMTVDQTTLDGNDSKTQGGAILNRFGEVTVMRSVLSGNTATNPAGTSYGGAVNNFKGEMAFVNTTFSGNTADRGGAIRNYATDAITTDEAVLILQHVTMTQNEARTDTYGGAIYNNQVGTVVGRVNLQNTLILGNITPLANKDCRNDGGIMESFGYNVKSGSALAGCSYSGMGTGDVSATGASSSDVDPTLANNGGRTKTHAIPLGSEARNIIPTNVNGCDANQVDQRYFLRDSANATTSCDAGAYEYGAGCHADLVLQNQTLAGPNTLFQASSSVTLGSNLTILGVGVEVNTPTVALVSPATITGPFTIGHTNDCP